MISNEMMPATEANELIDELGLEMRKIVDELPAAVMRIVRDKCGGDMTEAELERVDQMLLEFQRKCKRAKKGSEKNGGNVSTVKIGDVEKRK